MVLDDTLVARKGTEVVEGTAVVEKSMASVEGGTVVVEKGTAVVVSREDTGVGKPSRLAV